MVRGGVRGGEGRVCGGRLRGAAGWAARAARRRSERQTGARVQAGALGRASAAAAARWVRAPRRAARWCRGTVLRSRWRAEGLRAGLCFPGKRSHERNPRLPRGNGGSAAAAACAGRSAAARHCAARGGVMKADALPPRRCSVGGARQRAAVAGGGGIVARRAAAREGDACGTCLPCASGGTHLGCVSRDTCRVCKALCGGWALLCA